MPDPEEGVAQKARQPQRHSCLQGQDSVGTEATARDGYWRLAA